jgi:HK97 family phage portal protein
VFLSNGKPFPTVAEALGETTPLYVGGNYYSSSPLQLDGLWMAYSEMYRRQLMVYTVCRKIGISVARLDLKVGTPAAGGVEDASDSDYARLLAHPNPRMSPKSFWLWMATTKEIFGESMAVKLRDRAGRVRELHPMHPSNTVVRRNDDDTIEYIFTSGVRNTTLLPPIPEADVVHFKTYNPDNLLRGMSQLEPLRRTLANEDAIRRANSAWWNNGARPSMILTAPGKLKPDAIARIRASWYSAHAGAGKMGGTAILEEGMDAKPVQLNAEEMQYIESRKLNREEVCAASMCRRRWCTSWTTRRSATSPSRCGPCTGTRWRPAGRVRVGDRPPARSRLRQHRGRPGSTWTEVLRGDFETRAKAVVGLVVNGVMKPSEGRPLFNLGPAGPEANRLYANQAMQPLGTPVAGSAPAGAPGALPPGKTPLAIEGPRPDAVRAERSLMGRLGAVKALATADRQLLVDEHARQLRKLFEAQRTDALAGVSRKAAAPFNAQSWDQALADLLTGLATATAKVLGGHTAASLGGSFDIAAMADWIHDNAVTSAQRINTTTLDQLAAALEDAEDPAAAIGHVYDILAGPRTDQIAATRVAGVGGLAQRTAAGQSGATHKTWITGPNPRADHAGLAGQTVPLGRPFSNGMDGPGDPSGGADEVAGCNCSLSFTKGAS